MIGMIIGYYPGYARNPPSLSKVAGTHLRHIGYWASSPDRNKCRYYRIDALVLPWPGDFVDEAWDLAERNLVIEYLNKAPIIEWWMGIAQCRLCGEELGAGDHSDGTYTWPQKFSHYLEKHGVRPPQEFVRHVLVSSGGGSV